MKLHKWTLTTGCGVRSSILACSFFVVLFAQAADYTLENESVSWADSDNDSGKSYLIRGEVTITMSAGSTRTRLWSPITVSDGAKLTLDLSQFSNSQYLFVNRLVAEGTGKVRVKGNPSKVVYGYPGFLVQPISIFGVRDFAFVDAGGDEKADPLIFSNMSCILTLPKNGAVWSGAMVAVFSSGIVTPGLDGAVTLSTSGLKELMLYADDALPAGTRVVVPSGCKVYEVPMAINASYAYSRPSCGTNSTAIALDGGTLSLLSMSDHVVSGDITGTGTISMDAVRGRAGDERTWLTGSVSPSVSISVVGGMGSSSDRLALGANAAFAGVSLGDKSDMFFEDPSGAFSSFVSVGSLSSTTTNGVLHVKDGQTVSLGAFSGRFMKVGAGSVVFSGGVEHHDIVLENAVLYSSAPWSDIESVDASGIAAPRGGTAVALGGDVPYANVPENIPVTAEAGRTARIIVGSGSVPTVAGGEGDVTLTVGSWKDSVAIWVDPNAKSTVVRQPGDLALQEWIDAIGTDPKEVLTRELANYGCPLIESISDCRSDRTYYSLRNARDYIDVRLNPPRWADGPNSYAYIDTITSSGMKYINCGVRGSSRRMPIGIGQVSSGESHSLKATLVVMAYNAASGGGQAIVGTTEGAFERTNTSVNNPIVNKAISGKIRKNGVEVADPTSTDVLLDAGWQILTVDVSAYTLTGFGINTAPSGAGGQGYGDILVFTNTVSQLEIMEIERMLSAKWGVAYGGGTLVANARAVGRSGVVNVDSDVPVTIGGDFAGTLNVTAGSVLNVSDEALPPEESDLPTDGRVAWYDANKEDSFVYASDSTCATEIISWFSEGHTLSTVTNGETFLWAPKSRGPAVLSSARGFGPERKWIHFGTPDAGDNLRFRTKPYQDPASAANTPGYDGGAQSVPFKSAFIAMDSCLGGGSPLLADSIYGGNIRARTTGEYTEPIWLSLADYYVRNCDTRLNSVAVNGTTHGFTGGPEVFSFALSQDINAFCLGYFDVPNCEIEGELLLYSRELIGAERLLVEAYMMHKWCGMLPTGYSDLREAAIVGEGTVVTAAAKSPRLAMGFAGTLRFSDDDPVAIPMCVNPADGTVDGSIIAPSATLSSSAACIVDVAFSSRPRAGTYVLVDVASSDVSWTVNLPNVPNRSMRANVTPNRVTVTVDPVGVVLIVE